MQRCGKLIVALEDSQLPALDTLQERAARPTASPASRRLDAAVEIPEIEPPRSAESPPCTHSATGIVD